jgi:hypothetical protein
MVERRFTADLLLFDTIEPRRARREAIGDAKLH